MRAQLELCIAWGGDFALFSYDSLFATAGDRGSKGNDQVQRERNLRREVLGEFPRR
jgi:hypothetical protein